MFFERYDGTTVSAIRPGLKLLKNNTSGVRGVFWESSSQRWVATISLRGKTKKLGRFANKEDAIRARKEAEEEFYTPIIEAFEAEKKKMTEPCSTGDSSNGVKISSSRGRFSVL